jgi:hypothetical protein
MQYQPVAAVVQQLDTIQEPYFGGEFGVYLTTVAALQIGIIFFNSAGNVTYTPNIAASLPAAGNDLQLVAESPNQALPTDPQVVIALTGTAATGGALTGSATFAQPSWAQVQGPQFSVGAALDVSAGGTKWGSVASVAATGGSYGLTIGVWSLPQQTDYQFIGCTTEIDFNTKSRVAKGVDCRMVTDAFVKAGKSQPGELRIGTKMFSMKENMAPFNGLNVTAMLVGVKDGLIIGDRLMFVQYHPTIKPKLPDGDGEAMLDAEGKFVDHGFFVAPGPP